MKTLLSFMQKHTTDDLGLRTSDTRQAAADESSSLPICNSLFSDLAGLMLVGATLLGQISPAQANHSVVPFGIHCDSVGPNGTVYVPGVNCRVMAVDGYTRRYVAWVPLAGVPANAPSVFMLHGGSGTGEQFLRTSGWREKATQEGFVAIFPTAVEHFVLDKQHFSTRWNNYDLPVEIDPNNRPIGYPATSPWPADDVKFIRQIGEDVTQQLSTDPKRRYVAGFSSGGAMCARLGVELSDTIAAVACHGGLLDEVHETLIGHRNLSMYSSIGTLDENALEGINALEVALGQPLTIELPLAPSALNKISQLKSRLIVSLDSYNLSDTLVATVTDPDFTELTAQIPQQGNLDGNEFHFSILGGVEHEYPNGTNNPPINFNLPDLVWPFFVAHPMP
jgi:dienelactone hydrolase